MLQGGKYEKDPKTGERMKLKRQLEWEEAFKKWITKKNKERAKNKSISRQWSKDRLSKNYSEKWTPKSLLKSSRYTEGNNIDNLRSSKTYKRKDSPWLTRLRTSRSNSSKRNRLSSK